MWGRSGCVCVCRHPHFRLHSQLLDAHLYIVSKWVLDYLHENRSLIARDLP